MTRAEARKHNCLTYNVKRRCALDGSTERYTANAKCVLCETYIRCVNAGRINGVDMRTPAMKQNGVRARNLDKWCDEMRQEHAAAIRRGQARAKLKREAEHGKGM